MQLSTAVQNISQSPRWETLRGRKVIVNKQLVNNNTELNIGTVKGLYIVKVLNTQTGEALTSKVIVN